MCLANMSMVLLGYHLLVDAVPVYPIVIDAMAEEFVPSVPMSDTIEFSCVSLLTFVLAVVSAPERLSMGPPKL